MSQGQHSDASLGNQGLSDFNSMISPQGGQQGQQSQQRQGPPPSQDGTPRISVQEFEERERMRQGAQGQGQQQGQENGDQGQQQNDGQQQGQEGDQQQQGQQDGQQQQQQGQTQQPVLSQADLIKHSIESTINSLVPRLVPPQQQQQAPTQKDLTPEEFNAKYKVIRVTPDHMAALRGEDPGKAANVMTQLLQGAVTQGLLMGIDIQKAELERVTGTITPHIDSWKSYRAEQEAKAAFDRFYSIHPDYRKEHDLVVTIKDALLARISAGTLPPFKTEQEAFAAVATAMRAHMSRFGGSAANSGQQGQQNGSQSQTQGGQGQSNGRRMSAASSVGRSGSGKAAVKSDVDIVFGADAR